MATRKVTFTLDEATAARIDQVAARLRIPKSRVVREAIREYSGDAPPLNESEKTRMLAALDQLTRSPPTRTAAEVDREIAEIRRARRTDGRRHGRGP